MNRTLVSMKAKFITDGNPEDKRRRTVNQVMDADKILSEKSLQKAIEYFEVQVDYVDSIEDFEYFTIDGKTYEKDFWSE